MVISLVHEPAVVRRICLFVDRYNPPYAGTINSIIHHCRENGVSLSAATPSAQHLKSFSIPEDDGCDMAMALGGDGTILRCMGYFLEKNVPVLGVNAGHLGFLAGAEKNCISETVKRVSDGDYVIRTSPVLKAVFPSGHTITALNDFSINRSMMGGILHFTMYVDGEKVANIAGDGVVVSTPLGSTAYSLSCGGPIMDPELPAILVVPICPHSLSLRPMVIFRRQTISLEIGELRSSGPVVSADGSPSGTLKTGEVLEVGAGDGSCMTVSFPDSPGYYRRLGLKLGWGVRG